MEFIVIATVAAIFSAGVFVLLPAPFAARLNTQRAAFSGSIRDALTGALTGAATAANKYITGFRTSRHMENTRRELYSALSILRNHASVDGTPVTSDFLLEQFALSEGTLRDAYASALRLLRTGRRAEAAEYFSAAAVDPLARDFILLVLDWDAVPAQKLKQTITAFQNALRETRTTDLVRKNEVMSDLVYLPVITGVLIIFVNFIYVAYFAEQRALLAELFF